MTIIVTVGICIRNAEESIKSVIESVLNQDFPKDQIEIIFVDDGSDDRTLEIIEDFISRIEVKARVYRQNWRGIAAARNIVVQNARGKYIIWVDGDMILPSDYIRKQVEYMENNPKVGVAKARYGLVENGKIVAILENSRAFDLYLGDLKLFGTGGSICRVEAIRAVGGFDEHIKGAGEDIDAHIRILKKGWLLSTTDAEFYEQFKRTWRDLWRQYYWWGYGAHYIQHKHKNAVSIFVRLPPFAFIVGVLRFLRIYHCNKKIIYMLVPLHNVFKETAWCFGFIRSHADGYGHKG